MMRHLLAAATLAAACGSRPTAARAEAPLAPSPAPATVSIRFHGASTLHDFTGRATTTRVVCPLPDPGQPTWSADVTVAVADLDTGNATRDQKMRAMLDAANFPLIRGRIIESPIPTASVATVSLALCVRDRTNAIPARLSDWAQSPTNLAFGLAFDVSLKSFGLKAPSVAGLIRVADRVPVTCRLDASPPAP